VRAEHAGDFFFAGQLSKFGENSVFGRFFPVGADTKHHGNAFFAFFLKRLPIRSDGRNVLQHSTVRLYKTSPFKQINPSFCALCHNGYNCIRCQKPLVFSLIPGDWQHPHKAPYRREKGVCTTSLPTFVVKKQSETERNRARERRISLSHMENHMHMRKENNATKQTRRHTVTLASGNVSSIQLATCFCLKRKKQDDKEKTPNRLQSASLLLNAAILVWRHGARGGGKTCGR